MHPFELENSAPGVKRMTLRMVRGTAASELLKSGSFHAEWIALCRQCPWATASQSPGFVNSWYETYKDEFSPLLVCEFSAANELRGFLPLAVSRSDGVVFPGTRQAEYKSWLALPANGARFLNGSLALLSREVGIGALAFRYLPAGAPIESALCSADSPWVFEVETHKRPIVQLGSASEVAEYLREKTNKTIRNSWNRLKRMGAVHLEPIRECEELIPIFDQLIEWYEARQEKAHGKRPFKNDPRKKPWHLQLLKEGLVDVTLLRVGGEIASALFGLSDGKTYSVMMPMFAPEYASYSPIAIHHLMLVEQLHARGFTTLDLTPGPDPFKERFAGSCDEVSIVSIYFKQSEWIKAKIRTRGVAIAKDALAMLGMTSSTVARQLARTRARTRALRLACQTLAKAFPRWKGPRTKPSYD